MFVMSNFLALYFVQIKYVYPTNIQAMPHISYKIPYTNAMNFADKILTCTVPRLIRRVPAVVAAITKSVYRYTFFIRTQVL